MGGAVGQLVKGSRTVGKGSRTVDLAAVGVSLGPGWLGVGGDSRPKAAVGLGHWDRLVVGRAEERKAGHSAGTVAGQSAAAGKGRVAPPGRPRRRAGPEAGRRPGLGQPP